MKKVILGVAALAFFATSCAHRPVRGVTTSEEGAKLTDGEKLARGKTIFENSCGRCHDLPNPKDHNDKDWIGIVNVMARKAKLTAAEGEMVYMFVSSRN